jgi:hypothetical protein
MQGDPLYRTDHPLDREVQDRVRGRVDLKPERFSDITQDDLSSTVRVELHDTPQEEPGV